MLTAIRLSRTVGEGRELEIDLARALGAKFYRVAADIFAVGEAGRMAPWYRASYAPAVVLETIPSAWRQVEF